MEIPPCANFKDGLCPRSDTVIAETRKGDAYVIVCRTCKGINVWSRSKVKAQAKEQLRLKRIHEASERDRQAAARAVKFYAPRQGWITR